MASSETMPSLLVRSLQNVADLWFKPSGLIFVDFYTIILSLPTFFKIFTHQTLFIFYFNIKTLASIWHFIFFKETVFRILIPLSSFSYNFNIFLINTFYINFYIIPKLFFWYNFIIFVHVKNNFSSQFRRSKKRVFGNYLAI